MHFGFGNGQVRRFMVAMSGAALLPTLPVVADEGMWPFSAPPLKPLQDKYQFTPSPAWLEHLQRSSVRFVTNGASGSFVSPDGLILTNQHVGYQNAQALSDETHDHARDGFYARAPDEEKPCPGLELNVLVSTQDVTARVNAALPPGLPPERAVEARRQAIAEIEKESLEHTGLRSNVVALYQGGIYQLYRYKRYTDVRLVFIPDAQAAFFGGGTDNFEYPRYAFDVCLFRAYENGRPARVEHYLKVDPLGAADNGLVLVSGHPGATQREFTCAQIIDRRDNLLPRKLARLCRLEVALWVYSGRDAEHGRQARGLLLEVQNARKEVDAETGPNRRQPRALRPIPVCWRRDSASV
jgi:hypothetical protein